MNSTQESPPLSLSLRRISSFEELLTYIPKLVAMYKSLDGLWAPELNEEEFVAELCALYKPESYYFADCAPDGEIMYFTCVYPQDSKKLFFWLFYMHPGYRYATKQLIFDMIAQAKADGYEVCYTSSTRKESSYERWIQKFGAEKLSVTYRIKL